MAPSSSSSSSTTSKIVTGIRMTADKQALIQALLQSSNTNTTITLEDKDILQHDLNRGLLSSASLKLLMTHKSTGGGGQKQLFENLKDIQIVMENPTVIKVVTEDDQKQEQEKQARREYLQIKLEERMYNQMIYGKDS